MDGSQLEILPRGTQLVSLLIKREEDGHFYIIEGRKNLIKCQGYQVSPTELEGILVTHPCIKEAVVIPKRHPIFGEVPKAFVVLEAGTHLTEEEVKKFLAKQVSSFKKLHSVQFVPSIPRTSSTTILYKKLIEQEVETQEEKIQFSSRYYDQSSRSESFIYDDSRSFDSESILNESYMNQLLSLFPSKDHKMFLLGFITAIISNLMEIPSKNIKPDSNLEELGMDPMTGIELRDVLSLSLDEPVSTTLTYEFGTPESICDYLWKEYFTGLNH